MTDEMPMDLRSLGEVDEPEVVRQALRRFRRKALKGTVWIVLIVIAVASTLVARSAKRDLSERIDGAKGFVPGTVYQRDHMTALLAKVADLGDVTGFHIIVSQPGTGPQHSTGRDVYRLTADDEIQTSNLHSFLDNPLYDYYFSVRVPESGLIRIGVEISCMARPEQFNERGFGFCRSVGTIPVIDPLLIDLRALGVPRSIWDGGSR
jgi:hypothetical protein